MDVQTASAVAMCTLAYYNYVKCLTAERQKDKQKENTILINDEDGDEDEQRETERNFTGKIIKKKQKKGRCWMIPLHRDRTRHTMEQQFRELMGQSGGFENFVRMSMADFCLLLSEIEPMISKQDTRFREAIPAKIRLAITLRYLATGESFRSLHFLFKISSSLISKVVINVCKALNDVLKEEIKMPSNEHQWLEVQNGFKNNFPHAIGALDGKHIFIKCPSNTGHSLILLALVDSDYNFMYADICSEGRQSDGEVFKNFSLWKKITSNNLNLPEPRRLCSTENVEVPYFFLANGAFALHDNVMRPYPGSHDIGSPQLKFNTRLSRSRVVCENVFGILASRFQIFKYPIDLHLENAAIITKTCVLLHNFLKKSDSSSHMYMPPGILDVYDHSGVLIQRGTWREKMNSKPAMRTISQISSKSSTSARQLRDYLTDYFSTRN